MCTVPSGSSRLLQLPQDSPHRLVRKVVQKAVHQDGVKGAERRQFRCLEIGLDETAAVLPARDGQIALVDVDADVVDVGEARRIRSRTAPDVEHATHVPRFEVALDRSELLRDEGRLPGRVDRRMLHDPVDEPHSSPPDFEMSDLFTVRKLESELLHQRLRRPWGETRRVIEDDDPAFRPGSALVRREEVEQGSGRVDDGRQKIHFRAIRTGNQLSVA